MNDSKVARKFDRQARIYEKQRDNKALAAWRNRLIPYAHGNVLELAVGAGANFAFYEKSVHVTAVDISPNMVEKAQEGALEAGISATFLLGNAETMIFPEKTFDTVVSTLSFCGYEDPLQMLEQISHWCKPDGTILLLEHGISSNGFIAPIQKAIDPIAKRIVGCHQNRNIIDLLKKSSLDVVAHDTYLQQIFHSVIATPKV